jgi:hypothetical protein
MKATKRYWLNWLKAAGIRALKTFGQTAASLITVGAIMSEVSWGMVFSAATVALIYSLLTSVAGLPEVSTVNNEGEEINKGYDEENSK